ncbi:MAG: orotate phosphoribosyltransferase [Pseudomonadales bacterium]|nr:orotate phosphoribosyltransferase [Pseudomonadales bacterium]
MKSYQKRFIELAIEYRVLTFGEFVLKSGRVSPYFFNAGLFRSGRSLLSLARCYAEAIEDSHLDYDVIFGPAYKGIPLAASIAMVMAEKNGDEIPYAFNRKEKKDHGEGGCIVGAPITGKKVLIVDDVITAGTAIREVRELLEKEGATIAGVVVGLDRQEKGQGELSAIQELESLCRFPVVSVVTLTQIVAFLRKTGDSETIVAEIELYRERYGIKSQ